jgi:hypothetical protein
MTEEPSIYADTGEDRVFRFKGVHRARWPITMRRTPIEWEDTEPAPPKDWKPICFFGSEKCIFPTQIESRFDESCKHCPFKK